MIKLGTRLIFSKIEGVYGQDAAPVGADAVLAYNVVLDPLVGTSEKRERVDRLGAMEMLHTGAAVGLEFDVDLAGSGVADTPTAWSRLLRACAHGETINVGTSCEYSPIETGEESVSTYFNIGRNQKHGLLGVRGEMGLRLKSPGKLSAHFKCLGLWMDPAEAAAATPDFTAWQKPVAVNNTNTTFTLLGYSALLAELSLDQKLGLVHRNLVGGEYIGVPTREWTGSVTIQAPAMSLKNFFTTAKADTLGALQLVHGTAAGKILQIDAPNVQLGDPKYGEADGAATLQIPLTLIPTAAGNDEIKMTTK